MRKKISVMLVLAFCFIVQARRSYAQIQVSNTTTDYCSYQYLSYIILNYDPAYTYNWYFENYTIQGVSNPYLMLMGSWQTLSISSDAFEAGTMLVIQKVDPLLGVVDNFVQPLTNSYGNYLIPYNYSYYGCGSLAVPYSFGMYVSPFGGNRWAMWYKNGVPTGEQSPQFAGPLNDSAYYEYKLKLDCGDTITTGPIFVWGPAKPGITAQGPTTVCQGDTVVLSAVNYVNIQSWRLNGTVISGSNGKTSIKATQSGSYTYTSYSNSGGGTQCYQNTDPFPVTVNSGAFITGASVGCTGDSVALTCTTANSYVWRKNGNVIAGASSNVLWVKTSGQYQVNTTGLVCNSSTAKTVTFFPKATVSVTPSVTQDLCSGAATVLAAAGTNIFSYQWFKYSNPLTGAIEDELALTTPGTYKCVVTNAVGCSKTSNAVVVSSVNGAALPQKKITLQPGTEGVDAYVTSAFGNFSTNFGYAPTIEVSNWFKYFRTAERGFMKFDLSMLPEKTPIISAKLKLYVDTIDSTAISNYATNAVLFKRCIQPWLENTISWNSAPDSSDFQYSSVPCKTIASKSWITANLLNQVKHWSWKPAENYGLYMQMDENKQLSWVSLISSDHPDANHHPKLIISYYYADIIPNGTVDLCTGGSVTFSTNAGPYSYQWYKNGNPVNGATSSTYTTSTAGDYYVTITANSGCSVASLHKTVTINANPVANLNQPAAVSFCSGGSLVLQADSFPGYTYQWKLNNVNIAGAVFRSYTVTQPGLYTVKVTSACGKTAKDSVVCSYTNTPAAQIAAGGPTTFCAGQSVVLTANSFSGVTYQWRRNGTDIPTATASSYTAVQQGFYTVKETAAGCDKISNGITVTVNCREGLLPNDQVTAVVIPMPVEKNAVIQLSGLENTDGITFEVIDLNGKVLRKLIGRGMETAFDAEGIAEGYYLLRTLQNGQVVATTKLVIAR